MAIEFYQAYRKKLVLSFGASDTEKSQEIYLDGLCHRLHVRLPNFSNAVTATVAMADNDNYAYFEQTGLAKNANHNIAPDPPLLLLGEGGTVKMTLSGVPGGTGGEVVVALYYWGRP